MQTTTLSRIALAVPFVLGLGCFAPLDEAASQPPTSDATGAALAIDAEEIVSGVPDGARDPAVLALRIGGVVLCSATLVAPDILLTARHCVAPTAQRVQCPADRPQVGASYPAADIEVLGGDQVAFDSGAPPLARGIRIFVPDGAMLCGADIAVVLLDKVIEGIRPLPLADGPVEPGARVRAVGFGLTGAAPGLGAGAGIRRLREHVLVLSAEGTEFAVGEATCQGDSGGPALDQSTSAVLGVISRGGPSCTGADVHNIYTQVSPYVALLTFAKEASASSKKTRKPGSSKPVSEMGKTCDAGLACATGVCVNPGLQGYCSRACGGADRCPSGYHCRNVQNLKVCTLAK